MSKPPVDAQAAADAGSSQAMRAQLRLRELILGGEWPPGERVGEVAIVERLGMSRTPIRSALMRLEQEGLLEALAHGGYAVRSFSEQEVCDAIELRGTLEGLAARLAAERGVAPHSLDEASQALCDIDAVLVRAQLDDADFARYVAANRRFHDALMRMCGSRVLQRELERVVQMPFASPSAFVVVQADSPHARDMLIVAQDQHRQLLEAIRAREGARAEALAREHCRIAQRNLREATRERGGRRLPGVGLIRTAATAAPEPAAVAEPAAAPVAVRAGPRAG
ncbi:MAG: GntR family transcriptional regulator [Comamonadaceae bacterium]|nr:MAG: GntR family transcriptional regulator [Comamonadaceae bacterium]